LGKGAAIILGALALMRGFFPEQCLVGSHLLRTLDVVHLVPNTKLQGLLQGALLDLL
jgi:hypothetical protein